MSNLEGNYKVGPRGEQWLGTTVLLQAGNMIEVGPGDVEAVIRVTVGALGNDVGHLCGHEGTIFFKENASRGLGYIWAPPTSSSASENVKYYLALSVRGVAGQRTFRVTIVNDPTPSDENGGEWDGEDEP